MAPAAEKSLLLCRAKLLTEMGVHFNLLRRLGSTSKAREPAGHFDHVSDQIRAWNGLDRTPCFRAGTEVGPICEPMIIHRTAGVPG